MPFAGLLDDGVSFGQEMVPFRFGGNDNYASDMLQSIQSLGPGGSAPTGPYQPEFPSQPSLNAAPVPDPSNHSFLDASRSATEESGPSLVVPSTLFFPITNPLAEIQKDVEEMYASAELPKSRSLEFLFGEGSMIPFDTGASIPGAEDERMVGRFMEGATRGSRFIYDVQEIVKPFEKMVQKVSLEFTAEWLKEDGEPTVEFQSYL